MGNHSFKRSVMKSDPLGTMISSNYVAILHSLYVALSVSLNRPIKGLNMAYILPRGWGPLMGNHPLKHSVIKLDPLGTLIS